MLLSDFLKPRRPRQQRADVTSQAPVLQRPQARGFRTMELFSGAGLATEGMLAAGVNMVRCIEWNVDADATARGLGHPSVCGDVRNHALYENVGKIDLMWGSPPCQAWSQAGKRLGKDDPRNGFPWMLDAVDLVTPRWVIVENVPGVTFHKSGCGRNGRDLSCAGCYWDSVESDYKDRYKYVSWRILTAADFGAPQVRQRVFMVAGPMPFEWPEPTYEDYRAKNAARKLPRWRSIRDVLVTPGLDGWCSETNRSAADYRLVKSIDIPINTIAAGSPGSHTGCGFAFTFDYEVGERVPVGAPRLAEDAVGEKGIRRPTVDETARLMGMPGGVSWKGNVTAQRQQIGNGVCPQVSRVLAERLLEIDKRTGARGAPMQSSLPVMHAGSRYARTSALQQAEVASAAHTDFPTVQVWSVRFKNDERQQTMRRIESFGGHHLDWFPYEEDVPPLEKMSEAKSGNWLFLVPREALPALRKAGIITGQRVSA